VQIALTVLAILGTLGGAWIGSAIPSRYQERIERKREQAEIRAARRLIANELNVLAAHLKAVAELGKPPPGPIHNLLPMEAWGEQRLVLARAKEIDILEWRRIDIVYARVELLRHRLQYELGGDDVTNFRDTGAKAEYIRNMLIGDELQAAVIDPEIDVTWDAPSEVA